MLNVHQPNVWLNRFYSLLSLIAYVLFRRIRSVSVLRVAWIVQVRTGYHVGRKPFEGSRFHADRNLERVWYGRLIRAVRVPGGFRNFKCKWTTLTSLFFNWNCLCSQGIDHNSASFLISVIGITNTVGRVFCGYIADFPKVDSLLLNNICLVISTVAVGLTPFCKSYASYVTMAIFFGIAVCKYHICMVFLEELIINIIFEFIN